MPAVRAIVREMLESMGFRHFEEAEDGDMAWRMIRDASAREHSQYRLVVSDWLMPGLDGIELVQQVRGLRATAELPFLMVTSQSEQEKWHQAREAGVSGFVVKPFDRLQLQEQLNRVWPDGWPVAVPASKRAPDRA